MKNSNPLEKVIEAKIRQYALSKGCLCYKFTSPNRRSVPDRLFIAPGGVVWFIEFKRRGEKPTAAQAIEIATLKMKGANVFVCDSVEDGKMVVNQMILKGY